MIVIKNPDESQRVVYQIARVVYAETEAVSLRVVEALTSMIANASSRFNKPLSDIVSDKSIFTCLDEKSPRHELLTVDANNRRLQMCVRVAKRMIKGGLADCCSGAVRFHHDDVIPDWAMARGYIADIDGLLFYL